MRFKSPRINQEFAQLHDKNIGLKQILSALDLYCQAEMGQDVCITHIYRTAEEHKQLYAATVPAKRPADSPHCHWNAADIRSSEFDDAEIDMMLKFLNCFTGLNGKPTAIYHSITGGVLHFHVAYR